MPPSDTEIPPPKGPKLVDTKQPPVPIEGASPDPSREGDPPRAIRVGASGAQKIIAFAAILALCYFGRLVIITILVAMFLAFILVPFVQWMERWRLPRSLASGIAVAVLFSLIYVASYFSYVSAVDFARELPTYTNQIKKSVVKYRQQAKAIQDTKDALVPQEAEDKNAIRVKQVNPSLDAGGNDAEWIEVLLTVSFIPFLVYFMLSWQGHVHKATVQLFNPSNRTTAYVTISNMSRMMRGFILGNLLVGVILGAASSAVFWWWGVPYFYFVGFISGFVSLVPYLGIVLALVPPLATSMGTLNPPTMALVAGAVVVLHLVGVNVLYPKILGKHLQLNPLVVTLALLFFGFLWGGMGLLLAVPLTAAAKIICDHVPELHSFADWLSDGDSPAA
ncbi:MAG TPA: AI-2E family transporter [Terriglobales bacterium]|nr:AI-2E family transporter [Terriglobales bacterium]